MSRMKILYQVTPEASASPIYHEMVTQLARCIQNVSNISLSFIQEGHSTPSLEEYDLVHFFGCWNTSAARLLKKSYDNHIPTVFSPLGGLQPWVVKKYKATFAFSAQKSMASHALAIHVCGKLEQETFEALRWNNHVALIKNPVLTSKVSFDDMAIQMSLLYQKVIDTYARLLLSKKSCQAIGELLAVGIDDTILQDKKRTSSIRSLLTELDDDDWRKINIYASDEHILASLQLALRRLQLDVHPFSMDDVDRYPSENHYAHESLASEKLLSRNPLTKSKLNDIIGSNEPREKEFIVRLFNLKYELERHRAPLSHLAGLYQNARFSDMDEDRLNEVANSMGILAFSQRIMSVMRVTLGLTEGFMPFKEKNDKGSEELTKEITKFNTY